MSHAEEEKLLRQARELRRRAQDMRNERLEKIREEVRKAESDRKARELREKRERDKKHARDQVIREFLLPLAGAFVATGYRIKAENGAPVFELKRTNVIPAETIPIYWREGWSSGDIGFHWQ